jgi:hypothetical protein
MHKITMKLTTNNKKTEKSNRQYKKKNSDILIYAEQYT